MQNHYRFIIVRRMLPVGFFNEFSILALLLLFPLFIHVISRRRRALLPPESKQQLPPSPPKLPIIGNLHQMGPILHRSLRDLSDKHGSLMHLHLGQVLTLVASSADEARNILKTHDLSFASRPPLKMTKLLFSGGIDLALAPYGEHWRHMRKLVVTHLLSTKMVESFRVTREEEVDFMIEKISARTTSLHAGAVDMREVLFSFANDIICRVVSGKFSREGRNDIFHELIEESNALLGAFHVEDYIPFLAWMDVFFGLGARAKRNAKIWDDLLDLVIKEHVDRSRDNMTTDDTDFVDVLLSLQKDQNMDFTISKDHIKALVLDIFGAGTDALSVVLEWAMAELVRNPEVMKKLQDEVREIANGKIKIREEDLREMKYLKAVLKEVLRLHPPAPLLLPRESTEDCYIGIYKIPKHTRIIINAWAIGRDPRFWEEPEEFQPERFVNSPMDFKGMDFQFLPFGAGRRICPGMKLAVSTIELALANLMHQFDWELPDGMTRENLDMDDAPGLSSPRKQGLHLAAKPCFNY